MVLDISRIKKYIDEDLWKIQTKDLPKRKKYVIELLKTFVIAFKEFVNDKCAEKASALTYFSMLSLVPVLALIIAIARIFNIKEPMERELERYLSGQTEILDEVRPLIENMFDTQGGGVVAGVSAVFLIFTVIRLLNNIEVAFNDMWDIKKSRRWERKISDYVAVILLGPILMIVASTATVFVRDAIQETVAGFEFLGHLRSGIIFFIKLLPYTILWLLLFGLYIIFPNTRVKFFPALLGGVIAGTLYQLNQQAFISFQFAFARYDAIYGGIAFLPLFLIWLQISWLIVLFGAEICYGAQYQANWEMNNETLKISLNHRKKILLLILNRIAKKFENEGGPLTIDQIVEQMNVPRKYINSICFDLEKSGLILKVDAEDTAYLPAFDIHQMDLFKVLQKYEADGLSDFDPHRSDTFKSIEYRLNSIEEKWKGSDANVLVKDL